jgi:hypothetical protein
MNSSNNNTNSNSKNNNSHNTNTNNTTTACCASGPWSVFVNVLMVVLISHYHVDMRFIVF